jgi:hypothetical protein
MFWNKPKWSKVPGCFEQHLQRREGNGLFPMERRKVSKTEVAEAQKMDQIDQDRFIAAVKRLGVELENLEDKVPGATVRDSSYLQKVQDMLEEAASIGGTIQNAILMLESIEEDMIQHLNRSMPDAADLLRKAKSLSMTSRIALLAQMRRKDTSILSTEEIPSILSEDLETISTIGYISRSFPDFRPCEADIRGHLDVAVKQGFDRKRAIELLSAWNRIREGIQEEC